MPTSENLAISCGSSHLCAAQLRMNPNGRCEMLGGHVELVRFQSSDPMLWLKALSDRFATLASRFKTDALPGFVVPGSLTLSKFVRLEQVPPKKRERLIAFEARQNVPYPIDEVAWDHCLVGESEEEFEVMIGAARLELVEALARYGKDAKLDPSYIEAAATALANGFRFNYPEVRGDVLLVAAGARSTDILLLSGTRLYARNVPFGGSMVSSEMADRLGVGFDEAEELKIASIEDEEQGESVAREFAAATARFLDRLASEVERSKALAGRQGFRFQPDRCFVAGGGMLIPRVEEALERRIGLAVTRYDTLRNIHFGSDSLRSQMSPFAPFLAGAVGAAIGCFLPDAKRINLLPASILKRRRFKRQQPFYILAALVASAAIALPVLSAKIRIRAYEEEVRSLEDLILPLQSLNAQIYERNDRSEKLKSVIARASEVAAARSNWIRLLNDLQARMGSVEDVWLDRMSLERAPAPVAAGRGHARVRQDQQGARLKIQGRFIDVGNPMSTVSEEAYQRLISLLQNVESSEFVARLKDERFDNSVPGILRFDFTLEIDGKARL